MLSLSKTVGNICSLASKCLALSVSSVINIVDFRQKSSNALCRSIMNWEKPILQYNWGLYKKAFLILLQTINQLSSLGNVIRKKLLSAHYSTLTKDIEHMCKETPARQTARLHETECLPCFSSCNLHKVWSSGNADISLAGWSSSWWLR